MQVKSKERVAKHGEVFTNLREVNAMLDLVQSQIESMDKTFLEPACGNGNFLAEILRRRMVVLNRKYGKSRFEYEAKAVEAVAHLYGIELWADNVNECRQRLLQVFEQHYLSAFRPSEHFPKIQAAIRHILQKNIVCGNALSYCNEDGCAILLTQWKFIGGGRVKRILFALETAVKKGGNTTKSDLLGDNGKPAAIIPHYHEFPPIHYLELAGANT